MHLLSHEPFLLAHPLYDLAEYCAVLGCKDVRPASLFLDMPVTDWPSICQHPPRAFPKTALHLVGLFCLPVLEL